MREVAQLSRWRAGSPIPTLCLCPHGPARAQEGPSVGRGSADPGPWTQRPTRRRSMKPPAGGRLGRRPQCSGRDPSGVPESPWAVRLLPPAQNRALCTTRGRTCSATGLPRPVVPRGGCLTLVDARHVKGVPSSDLETRLGTAGGSAGGQSPLAAAPSPGLQLQLAWHTPCGYWARPSSCRETGPAGKTSGVWPWSPCQSLRMCPPSLALLPVPSTCQPSPLLLFPVMPAALEP